MTAAGGTYDGSAFAATATVAGVNGSYAASLEAVTPTLAYYDATGVLVTDPNNKPIAPTKAGTYTVVASFAGSVDYASVTSTPVTFTIGKAVPSSVTVADAGGTYNDAPVSATGSVAGVVKGVDTTPAAKLENVGLNFTYYVGNSTTGVALASGPINAGTYTVVASFAGSVDYTPANSKPVTFTIGKAVPSVTAADAGGTYNDCAVPGHGPGGRQSGGDGHDSGDQPGRRHSDLDLLLRHGGHGQAASGRSQRRRHVYRGGLVRRQRGLRGCPERTGQICHYQGHAYRPSHGGLAKPTTARRMRPRPPWLAWYQGSTEPRLPRWKKSG